MKRIIALSLIMVLFSSAVTRSAVYQRVIPSSQSSTANTWAAGLVLGRLSNAVVNNPSVSYSARIVTGAGWLGLGVASGLLLYHYFWTPEDLGQIGTVATPPGNPAYWRLNGSTTQYSSSMPWQQGAFYCSGMQADWWFAVPTDTYIMGWGETLTHFVSFQGSYFSVLDPQGNYISGDDGDEKFCHKAGAPGAPVFVPATSGQLTEQSVRDWLAANPSSPLHPANRIDPDGLGQTAPVADVTDTFTMPETAVQTQVNPAPSATGDVVLAENVPPPAGTQTTESGTSTQTGTTTTTTTTNPDGSTTEQTQSEESTEFTCSGEAHQNRTMGTVLVSRFNQWQAIPLLASLNQLQGIVWPTTYPVITFPGGHSIDLQTYSWVFTSLSTLMIGGAVLYSYRIVFG